MKPLTDFLWQKDPLTLEDAATLISGKRGGDDCIEAEAVLAAAIDGGIIQAKAVRWERHDWKGREIGGGKINQYETTIGMADFKSYVHSRGLSADTMSCEVLVPVTRQKAQNTAILNWIEAKHLDPLKLPVPPQGKAGVKKDCKDDMCKDRAVFSSESVFKTAWDRLRANGEIKDAS